VTMNLRYNKYDVDQEITVPLKISDAGK